MIGREQVKPTQIKPSSNWKQFNDDQPLDIKNEIMNPDALQNYLMSSNFKLEMLPHQDRYKLAAPQDVPILVSLQSEELFKENGQAMHVNMDIVCVVDHSGSMEGLKIKYLRETLKYLVEQLRDNDRFSLVMFDDKAVRLTPLLRMSPENKLITGKAIDSVKPDGGTDINLGIQFALQVLAQRRQQNVITTIMLLTDGLDDGVFDDIKKSVQVFDPKINQNYTINTFGYGVDHDPLLMAKVAELKNGKFYFVDKLDEISLSFFDCLGGLLSTIGQNVEIKITVNDADNAFNKQVKIIKAYGNHEISADQKHCTIKIGQVLAGTSKDYIMIFQVPAVEKILQDHEKGIVLCHAICTMDQVKNQANNEEQKIQEKIVLNADVTINVLNQNEEQKEFEVDEVVEYHYLRFLASEQLQKAQNFAENNMFEQGSEAIDNILNRINFQTIKRPNQVIQLINYVIPKKAMQLLQEDLTEARKLMAPQMYNQNAGRHQIQQTLSSQMHQFQVPNQRGYEQYANMAQQNMVGTATIKMTRKN